MKNAIALLIIIFISVSCHVNKNIISSRPFIVKRKIIKSFENDTIRVLMADNEDIIETFKDVKNKKKCREIILGKKRYRFKVIPVSDLALHRNDFKYILNDSIVLDYSRYFAIPKFKNYCLKESNNKN